MQSCTRTPCMLKDIVLLTMRVKNAQRHSVHQSKIYLHHLALLYALIANKQCRSHDDNSYTYLLLTRHELVSWMLYPNRREDAAKTRSWSGCEVPPRTPEEDHCLWAMCSTRALGCRRCGGCRVSQQSRLSLSPHRTTCVRRY